MWMGEQKQNKQQYDQGHKKSGVLMWASWWCLVRVHTIRWVGYNNFKDFSKPIFLPELSWRCGNLVNREKKNKHFLMFLKFFTARWYGIMHEMPCICGLPLENSHYFFFICQKYNEQFQLLHNSILNIAHITLKLLTLGSS